jgi:predicted secreted protein
MKNYCFLKRNLTICILIVVTLLNSNFDVFGQLFNRSQRLINRRTVKSLKGEIILESNSSSRNEWKLGKTNGEKPTKNVLQKAINPGDSVVEAWDFGELQKSDNKRSATFHFVAFDSDNHPIKASFTFYPQSGRFHVEYNSSIGASWELDEEQNQNLQPKKHIIQAPDMPGAPSTEEWELGTLIDNNTNEGSVVFKYDLRGEHNTEVKIRLYR